MHNRIAQILSIYFRYYNILNKYICSFLELSVIVHIISLCTGLAVLSFVNLLTDRSILRGVSREQL